MTYQSGKHFLQITGEDPVPFSIAWIR